MTMTNELRAIPEEARAWLANAIPELACLEKRAVGNGALMDLVRDYSSRIRYAKKLHA